MTERTRRLLEAVGVGAVGGLLAGATGAGVGALVGSVAGFTVPAAIVGALNGAISGWRAIYDWRSSHGYVAFALDSSWNLVMTTAALFSHGWSAVQRDAGYVPELSERHNRHVYRRGFARPGFATTLGNVVGGAGDVERERRARLVTDHEDVHVWQSRWFGPLFPALYGGWMIAGGAVGAVLWVVARRSRGDRWFATVESAAYHINPFEWWGYSRDDYWPPNGKIADFGWRHPCCRPMAVAKPHRPSGLAQWGRMR